MAAPTNTFITNSAVGNRESLHNIISILNKDETPFVSTIGSGDADATYEEWQLDQLGNADTTNAQLEGDDTTGAAIAPTVRVGIVLQETAIRRLTYEGTPIVFRIDKIANDLGCSVPNSVASVLDVAFFLHKSGFHMIQGAQAIKPIGRGKVDRTFWAEFDEASHFRSSAAIDPVRGLYVFAYPSLTSSDGNPNRLLIYNWRTERWSRAILSVELIYGGVSQQG